MSASSVAPAPRSRVVPTNTLVCLFPPALFAPQLLPLFQAHFASYGTVAAWTPLERLGRVLVVYEDVESATAARREMDGFVWEDDDDDDAGPASPHRQQDPAASRATSAPDGHPARSTTPPPVALRAFFGPSLSLPLASLHSTLLAVPALSRNFLISPPGSPPVGWEQTLEEAPNRTALPEHPDDDGGMAWGDELTRALRYLSVSSNDADDESALDDEPASSDDSRSTTHVIVSLAGPQQTGLSITVSTPPTPSEPSVGTATPPPGAAKITAVKATIESMLGRKRSFGDLGAGHAPTRVIIPTARPPTADEPVYLAQ